MSTLTKGEKKRKNANWDDIREAIKYIKRMGGEVTNHHGRPRTFTMPNDPGLKTLGMVDMLVNWGGFTRDINEAETRALNNLRIPRHRRTT